ncbi:hypothetical protein IQ07DRAFT_604638 [Pyrenochaeta sp. DS3sAY3a]|nr:hypothetical protein IQ07DRAFT_604638 [Pyrenochaeta sp. DS3sAY3a]
MAEECFAAYQAKCVEEANEGSYEHPEDQARNIIEKMANIFRELDGSTSSDDFDYKTRANWTIHLLASVLSIGFSKTMEELATSNDEVKRESTKSLVEKFFGVVEKLKSIRSDEMARHKSEYELLDLEEKYELLHRLKTTMESLVRDLEKDHKLNALLPYLPLPYHCIDFLYEMSETTAEGVTLNTFVEKIFDVLSLTYQRVVLAFDSIQAKLDHIARREQLRKNGDHHMATSHNLRLRLEEGPICATELKKLSTLSRADCIDILTDLWSSKGHFITDATPRDLATDADILLEIECGILAEAEVTMLVFKAYGTHCDDISGTGWNICALERLSERLPERADVEDLHLTLRVIVEHLKYFESCSGMDGVVPSSPASSQTGSIHVMDQSSVEMNHCQTSIVQAPEIEMGEAVDVVQTTEEETIGVAPGTDSDMDDAPEDVQAQNFDMDEAITTVDAANGPVIAHEQHASDNTQAPMIQAPIMPEVPEIEMGEALCDAQDENDAAPQHMSRTTETPEVEMSDDIQIPEAVQGPSEPMSEVKRGKQKAVEVAEQDQHQQQPQSEESAAARSERILGKWPAPKLVFENEAGSSKQSFGGVAFLDKQEKDEFDESDSEQAESSKGKGKGKAKANLEVVNEMVAQAAAAALLPQNVPQPEGSAAGPSTSAANCWPAPKIWAESGKGKSKAKGRSCLRNDFPANPGSTIEKPSNWLPSNLLLGAASSKLAPPRSLLRATSFTQSPSRSLLQAASFTQPPPNGLLDAASSKKRPPSSTLHRPFFLRRPTHQDRRCKHPNGQKLAPVTRVTSRPKETVSNAQPAKGQSDRAHERATQC